MKIAEPTWASDIGDVLLLLSTRTMGCKALPRASHIAELVVPDRNGGAGLRRPWPASAMIAVVLATFERDVRTRLHRSDDV